MDTLILMGSVLEADELVARIEKQLARPGAAADVPMKRWEYEAALSAEALALARDRRALALFIR